MPPGNLNRILWAVMLLAIVVFGIKAKDNIETYFAGVGRLDVTPPEDGVLRLSWRGRIAAPMASKLSAAFNQYGGSADRVVLTLASPGGLLSEGRKVVGILKDIAASRRLETHVGSDRVCASMCVPVYLQGSERTAAADARFMFHQVSFRDFYEGKDDDVPASARSRATDQLFATYFAPAGVPARWIDSVKAKISGGEDLWISGGDLARDGSTIVQRTD